MWLGHRAIHCMFAKSPQIYVASKNGHLLEKYNRISVKPHVTPRYKAALTQEIFPAFNLNIHCNVGCLDACMNIVLDCIVYIVWWSNITLRMVHDCYSDESRQQVLMHYGIWQIQCFSWRSRLNRPMVNKNVPMTLTSPLDGSYTCVLFFCALDGCFDAFVFIGVLILASIAFQGVHWNVNRSGILYGDSKSHFIPD